METDETQLPSFLFYNYDESTGEEKVYSSISFNNLNGFLKEKPLLGTYVHTFKAILGTQLKAINDRHKFFVSEKPSIN